MCNINQGENSKKIRFSRNSGLKRGPPRGSEVSPEFPRFSLRSQGLSSGIRFSFSRQPIRDSVFSEKPRDWSAKRLKKEDKFNVY